MKLLTKKIRKEIPDLNSQYGKGKDSIVYVKFFTPWSFWTWYATEGRPIIKNGKEVDFEFYGYVLGDYDEWNYFLLSELKSIIGPFGLKVERDRWFVPKTLKEVTY